MRECLAHAPDGGLQILVRPRPGGFVYSPEEVGQMLRTVTSLLALGHRAPVRLGLVVGALRMTARWTRLPPTPCARPRGRPR